MRFDYGYSEGDHQGKPYDFQLLKRLWPFLRAYRKLLAGSLILVVLITALDLAIPYFTKVAIDRYILPVQEPEKERADNTGVIKKRYLRVDAADSDVGEIIQKYPELFKTADGQTRITIEGLNRMAIEDRRILRRSDLAGLAFIVVLFIGAVLMDFLFVFLQKMIMEYTGHKVMHDLRLQLFHHIQQQSMSFFTRQPVARLVTRVTNDVQNMHELFTTFIALVFKDLFLLAGIAVVLLILDWRLALAGFALLPLVAWSASRFSIRARDVFRALRVKVAQINTRMSESIEGIRTIQSFGRQDYNYRHFAKLNADNYQLGIQQIHIFGLFMPMIEVLGITSVSIIVLLGGLHVIDHQISLGVLVLVISYIRMFYRPLRDLAENYNILQNAMASAERLFDLLDCDERLPQLPSSKRKSPADKTGKPFIAFKDVSFSYVPGEKVLDHLSVDVTEGQTLALVGPTGAGKTSVLNLVMRLYDPDSGRIHFQGIPLREWDLGRLRSMMALVPQEPVLFSGTLRENIFQDINGQDEEHVRRTIEAANCSDLMARLPQGLDTPLIKTGTGLSSGERQLVAIARALARDPQLILLDEATSYIDSQTETAIHQALQILMAGRTCIMVAHRLSTARNADKIVVLQHGRAQEQGTHEELMAAKGLYWQLNRI